MIGELERRKLIEMYKDDPIVRRAMRAQYIVLAVAMAGIVLAGALYDGPTANVPAVAGTPQGGSTMHTRAIHLERRASYERRQAADPRQEPTLTEAARLQRSCTGAC